MTSVVEQPDTTKLRSAAGETRWPTWRQVLDLCDALDAARVERDEVKGLLDDKSRRDDTALMAYKREKHRAEAAEARIAAALDVAGHDFYQSEAQRLARDVRRALTEGTGQ